MIWNIHKGTCDLFVKPQKIHCCCVVVEFGP